MGECVGEGPLGQGVVRIRAWERVGEGTHWEGVGEGTLGECVGEGALGERVPLTSSLPRFVSLGMKSPGLNAGRRVGWLPACISR